ncbi:hypothetical protein WMF04_31225 [Sorangium sp. So ce260]
MHRSIVEPASLSHEWWIFEAQAANADLHIYRLTSDYLYVSSLVQILWAGSWREAPASFKRNGVYFLLTSGATGWDPNQQKYATASSIREPRRRGRASRIDAGARPSPAGALCITMGPCRYLASLQFRGGTVFVAASLFLSRSFWLW